MGEKGPGGKRTRVSKGTGLTRALWFSEAWLRLRSLSPSGESAGSLARLAAWPPLHLPSPTLPAPQLIYMHWMNTVVNYCGPFEYEVGYCERLKSFLETNLEWMQEEMELNQGSAYWHQVGAAPMCRGAALGVCSGHLLRLRLLLAWLAGCLSRQPLFASPFPPLPSPLFSRLAIHPSVLPPSVCPSIQSSFPSFFSLPLSLPPNHPFIHLPIQSSFPPYFPPYLLSSLSLHPSLSPSNPPTRPAISLLFILFPPFPPPSHAAIRGAPLSAHMLPAGLSVFLSLPLTRPPPSAHRGPALFSHQPPPQPLTYPLGLPVQLPAHRLPICPLPTTLLPIHLPSCLSDTHLVSFIPHLPPGDRSTPGVSLSICSSATAARCPHPGHLVPWG